MEKQPNTSGQRQNTILRTRDGCLFEILLLNASGLSRENVVSCFQGYDTTHLMSIRQIISEACQSYGRVPYAQCDVSVNNDDVIFVTVFAPDRGSTTCLCIVKVYPQE